MHWSPPWHGSALSRSSGLSACEFSSPQCKHSWASWGCKRPESSHGRWLASSPVPGSDAQPLLTPKTLWLLWEWGKFPTRGSSHCPNHPTDQGWGRVGGWAELLRHLWDVLVLWAQSSCVGDAQHRGSWVGAGEQRLVTVGVCQGLVVLEPPWVGRDGCETLSCPCCHLDLRAQGLALPLGSRSRSESKGGSHVAHSGSHPAGKGIQCMGVTWPSTWGLSHPELDPQAQKGRGKAAEKGVSRVVPRALLRSHFSHVPTDTWTPCKTLPRKIHSHNPTTPFLPSLLLHGVFPRGSW